MAIELEIKSNSQQAKADLAALNKSVDNISKSAKRTGAAIQKTVAIIGTGLAAALTAKTVTNISDRFKNIENRIALVTGRTKELNKTFGDLQKVALRSRGSLDGVADLYNRLARSSKNLGVSNSEIIQVTESIQKAIVISGADSAAANAAIVQLGQGLAAGALRGQELNSVMEQTPRVAGAIAAELGVGIGELRKLAEQGKITSEVVINAFKNQKDIIEQEFGSMGATTGQSFEQIGQSFGFLVSEFTKGTGAIDALNAFLLRSADSMLSMGDAARSAGKRVAELFDFSGLKDSALGSAINNILFAFGRLGSAVKRLFTVGLDRILPIETLLAFDRLGVLMKLIGSTIGPILAENLSRLAFIVDTVAMRVDVFASSIERNFVSSIFRSFTRDVFGAFHTLAVGINTVIARFNAFGAEVAFVVTTPLRTFYSLIGDIVYEVRNFSRGITSTGLTSFFRGAPDAALFFLRGIEVMVSGVTMLVDTAVESLSKLYVGAFIRPIKSTARSFGEIGATIGMILKGVGEILVGIGRELGFFLSRIGEVAGVGVDLVETWFQQMAKSAYVVFPLVVDFIARQLQKIKDFFYDAYVAIVGNSYWTDTIEGVVDKVTSLDLVTKFIDRWGESIKAVFSDILTVVAFLMGAAIGVIMTSIRTAIALVLKTFQSLAALVLLQVGTIVTIVTAVVKRLSQVASFEDLGQAIIESLAMVGIALTADIVAIFAVLVGTVLDYLTILSVALFDLFLVAQVTFTGIYSVAKPYLEGLANLISGFAERVLSAFWEIYDKVVGNSYWPDTIDGIISSTSKLDGVISYFKKWSSGLQTVFVAIFGALIAVVKAAVQIVAMAFLTIASVIIDTIGLAIGFAIKELQILGLTIKGVIHSFADVSSFRELGRAVIKASEAIAGGLILSLSLAINTVISMILGVTQALSMFVVVSGFALIDMFEAISESVEPVLNPVMTYIRKFGSFIKEEFYSIYDEVVGNSYWPDTIEGVLSHTFKLEKVLSYLRYWGSKVKSRFSSILKSVNKDLSEMSESFSNFTFDTSSIKTALSEGKSKVQMGLDKGFSGVVSISSVLVDPSSTIKAGAVIAAGIFAELLSFIRDTLPETFATVGGLALSFLLRAYNKVLLLSILSLGQALASGLISAEQIASTISSSIAVLAAGAGRALGALFNPANIIGFVAYFTAGLLDAIAVFGENFLKEFGVIGNAVGLIFSIPFVGAIGETIVGALVASFALVNFSELLIGKKGAKFASFFKTNVLEEASLLIMQFGQSIGRDWSSLNLAEALTGKNMFKKILSTGMSVAMQLKDAFKSALFSADFSKAGNLARAAFSNLSSSITAFTAVTKDSIKAVWGLATAMASTLATTVGNLIIAMYSYITAQTVSLGITVKSTFANGILAGSMRVLQAAAITTAAAFRAMWLSLLGPIGLIISLGAILFSLFGGASAFAENTADNMDDAKASTKGYFDDLLDWLNTDWYTTVEIEIKDADENEVKQQVKDVNRTLINAQRAASGRWFSDFRTDLERVYVGTGQAVGNALGLIFERGFEVDTRSVDEMLLERTRGVEPVEIPFALSGRDFNVDILGKDIYDKLASQLATYNEAVKNRVYLENSILPVSEAGLKFAREQEELAAKTLKLTLRENKAKINSNKYFRSANSLAATGLQFQERGEAFFGESLFKAKSALEIAKLDVSERKKLEGLYSDIAGATQEIFDTSSNLVLTEEYKNEIITGQIRLIQQLAGEVDELFESTKKVTFFDAAKGTDISLKQQLTMDRSDLADLQQAKQALLEAEVAAAKVANTGTKNLADIEEAQENVIKAKLKVNELTTDFNKSLKTNTEQFLTDLSVVGVSGSIKDLGRVSHNTMEILQANVEEYTSLNEKLSNMGPDDAIDGTRQDTLDRMAQLSEETTRIWGDATKNNFEKVLAPFAEIGVDFNLDDFKNLARTFSEDAIQQAKLLADKRRQILAKSYDDEEMMIREIAAFNRELYELEKKIAEEREDALANERFSEEIGNTLAQGVMDVLRGNKSIGEVLSETITNTMANSLQKRFASFFEGFINSILDSLSSKEGGMGDFVKSLIMPPSNAEQNDIKDLAGSLAGGLTEGDESENAIGDISEESIDKQKGIFEALPEKLSGVFDGFKDGLGGIFGGLMQGLGSIFSAIGGGIGSFFGLFFHTGGLVPDGGGYHKLNGGEMVLTEAQQVELFQAAKGNRPQGETQQTVNNIQITGDISRQTKKEIMKMLPTISTGVNQYNRENSR